MSMRWGEGWTSKLRKSSCACFWWSDHNRGFGVGATAENQHVYDDYIFIEWHTVHLVTFRQIQLDCTKHILKASQHHMNSTRLCNCNCNCRQCARLTQHTVHLTGGRKLEVGNSLLKQCGVLRSSIRECWWILLLHPMMQWHFSNADMNEMWYKTLNWNSWA